MDKEELQKPSRLLAASSARLRVGSIMKPPFNYEVSASVSKTTLAALRSLATFGGSTQE